MFPRNSMLRSLLSLGVSAKQVGYVLLCLNFLVTMANASEKPNVLLLLSDDHSYPYLSCYGDPNVKTPTLDRLAQEGIKCHRYFTAAPQCVPSRASLMTGRSPVAARMTRFSSPLPRDEVTLPELLREQGGYYTGICGRNYHLDGPGKGRDGELGPIYDRFSMRTFTERVDFLNTCGDQEVAGQLKRFLDEKPEGKPFFMWANFSDPHHVWNAPAQYRPEPKSLKLPPHWPDFPEMREELADYFAEINRLDRTIQDVLSVLEARQLMDKTLICFVGDNGAALPHGKGSLYDPGSNVPCVVRWPGVIPSGRETRALMSGEDVAPTILEAAGITPPSKMSGVSFLPVLKGVVEKTREHIFVERGSHGSNSPVSVAIRSSSYDLARAVRSDRYKLIYNCTPWVPYSPVDSAGGPGWQRVVRAFWKGELPPSLVSTYFTMPRPVYELYDLDRDPSELTNLSGQVETAKIENELRRTLAEKMILDFDYLPLPDTSVAGDSKNRKK